MIASLRGRLRRKLEDRVVVESAGVGYEVHLPPVVMRGLDGAVASDGEDASDLTLVTYYHASQAQPRPILIGFTHELEREFFERLLTVQDVGPLVAARALVRPVAEIAEAIARGDEKYLRGLPGIGQQKAKNMVAQLQGKVAKYAMMPHEAATAPPTKHEEEEDLKALVREVLVKQLGHRPSEADRLIEEALKRNPRIETPEALFDEIYRGRKGAEVSLLG